jgi:hypothetical protein
MTTGIRTSGKPSSSTRIRRANGPPAPCIPSKTIEKSGRRANSFIASKSKHDLRTSTYSVNGSIMVTVEVNVNANVVPGAAFKSISGLSSTVLKLVIFRLRS